MNQSCLLAVSLLAQGHLSEGPPVPQFTPPAFDSQLPAFSESLSALGTVALNQQFPLPSTEWFTPEFSESPSEPQTVSLARWITPAARAATPERSRLHQIASQRAISASVTASPASSQWVLVNGRWQLRRDNLQPTVRKPTVDPQAALTATPRPRSGVQLYQQRLAALKAGKIYTRLPVDSFAPAWTKSTAQPTHQQWQSLLASEARAIASGQGENRLEVLVGDSLSLWFPPESLPTGRLWLNQSVSGETSGHILRRIAALTPTQPHKIYLMAGINDLRQGATDETILANLHQIIRQLRQNHPQAQVVVQSILPTRLAAIPNARIQNINQRLEAIAIREGADYLDLHSHFTDEQGTLRLELTTDGIHLSAQGYEVWQQVLQSAEFPSPYESNDERTLVESFLRLETFFSS